MSTQFDLMKDRRFLPFFMTQFLGAFNDNLYKNALVILLTFQAGRMTAIEPQVLVNLCAGLFILPFFLFSASAGQLADRFEKARLIRIIKLLEVGIMAVAALALLCSSLWLLLAVLFLMGFQSTLFGPVKYAILPQVLRESELIGGNALVESGTFVAILVGTILAGILIGLPAYGIEWVAGGIVLLALLGYVFSRGIPPAPAADPGLRFNWNPLTETGKNIRLARQNRTVFLSILGISWFWFYGALFLSQFPGFASKVLGGSALVVTILLAVFSIGIGAGSMLCERLCSRMVEIGLVPFGSIGLSVFAVDLWRISSGRVPAMTTGVTEFLSHPANLHVLFDLLAIGVFGGFFIVPLYALVQSRSEAPVRARIIAANNILNAAFMVVAAVLAIILLAAGLSIPDLFLVTALMNAAVAVYIYGLVPEFLLRFLCWILIHTVYRLEKSGVEHIPAEGPALLVCNHVSLVDALVVSASCPRPIRFIMDQQMFRTPVLRHLFRDFRAIPICSGKQDPQTLAQAYASVNLALRAGELVCIFPEGRLTDSGELNPFRQGISRILADNPVPVVPLALRGLWGSFFSRRYGAAMSSLRRARPLLKIGIVAGPPLVPADATPERLQAEVAALRGEAC